MQEVIRGLMARAIDRTTPPDRKDPPTVNDVGLSATRRALMVCARVCAHNSI